MYFLFKLLRITIQNNFFLIIGIFLGVGLSSFVSQLIQNSCFFTSQPEFPAKLIQSSLIEDDYEPVINLAGKPQKAQKTPQDFVRPRYYRTELGIRDKLFCGVLTSPNTILDYGIAFNQTTNHLFEKTIFFLETEGKKPKSDLKLNGVVQFSDSRLILKPFHMLKYISDNFLDDFDYYFIVRDTSYVRGRLLNYFVNKISLRVDVHAGGRQDNVTNYCSISAGILISNLVLRKVSQNLDWCVKNAFSESDDSNLGRCIFHSSGLPCTSEVKTLKFLSVSFDTVREIDLERFSQNENFDEALTFWPMPNPHAMFLLHIYFSQLEILKKKWEISEVQKRIAAEPVLLPDNTTMEIIWPLGSPPSVKPVNRFDVLRWDYFTEDKIFLKSDFSNVEDLRGAELLDIQYVINASTEFAKAQHPGEEVHYVKLLNGYRRIDPTRGIDYILDVAFRNPLSGKEFTKRLEICKSLGPVELVPIPYVTENTRVNLILAVGEKNKHEVIEFMERYVKVCMEKKDKTFLMLVLLYEAHHPKKGHKNDIFGDVKKEALKHSDRFKKEGNKISWLSVKLPTEAVYSPLKTAEERSVGLNNGILTIAVFDLVTTKFSADNLILYCSSNMEIRQDYLNRVRMNTIKEWQVFSPIPFSEFHPDIVYSEDLTRPKEMDINRNYGHYDTLNTDHISFYVKDYREARKKIEHALPFILDDRDLAELPRFLFKKFSQNREENTDYILHRNFAHSNLPEDSFVKTLVKISLDSVYGLFFSLENIHVLRGVEPGLRLRHVEVDCKKISHPDDVLKPILFEQCMEKRNFNTGTRSQLGEFILNYMRKDSP